MLHSQHYTEHAKGIPKKPQSQQCLPRWTSWSKNLESALARLLSMDIKSKKICRTILQKRDRASVLWGFGRKWQTRHLGEKSYENQSLENQILGGNVMKKRVWGKNLETQKFSTFHWGLNVYTRLFSFFLSNWFIILRLLERTVDCTVAEMYRGRFRENCREPSDAIFILL